MRTNHATVNDFSMQNVRQPPQQVVRDVVAQSTVHEEA